MTQDADLAKFATADAAGVTGAMAPTE